MTCSCVFASLGVAAALYLAVVTTKWVLVNYFSSVDMKKKYGKAGNWAVVTGASEGIGHAMSLDLARRGFNVCVIARTKSKLDAVVEEAKKLNVEGHAIAFDFSTATDADWKSLFAELDKLTIGVLVNNVGINYDYVKSFDDADVASDLQLLKVNCESSMRMSKYVIPHMKEKRAGAIVVLSSFSAKVPAAMLATYAGTKAFNLSFGNALHWELKEFGIDVLTVTPNMVVSKMTQGKSTKVPKETFLTVNAAKMAHQTLDKLGSTYQSAGHINHCIIESIATSLPVNYVAEKILAMHKSVNKRASRWAKEAK